MCSSKMHKNSWWSRVSSPSLGVLKKILLGQSRCYQAIGCQQGGYEKGPGLIDFQVIQWLFCVGKLWWGDWGGSLFHVWNLRSLDRSH